MKRRKSETCESCLPGIPCVLHGAEPRTYDDSFDTPAARRRDINRRRAERLAVSPSATDFTLVGEEDA